ncbi:MAG: cytochrome P450 [Paracoccaceae bacterium]
MSFADTITIAALETDPFPIYARLRRDSPVAYVPAANTWFATRWADVDTIAKDTTTYSAEAPDNPINAAFGTPNILTSDGPAHRALRDGVEPHYRARKVQEYIENLVRPLAETQLATYLAADNTDLMSGYFEPVSALCLARSFGLQDTDAATLRRWFHGLSQGAINFERDPARAAISTRTVAEVDAAILPLLARLAKTPDGSPLSHMLHSNMPAGQTRAPEAILPTVKIILLGGMQEPGHGAGTVLTGLLDHPDQMAALRADLDALLPQAVDEGLRWIAPIGTMSRITTCDTVLGGTPLPRGSQIAAIFASANRDETRFANPDAFDIFRPRASHAAFGIGQHFCAGKWFAKAQIEILLRVLFEHFPQITRAGPAAPFNGWEFRAPTALHIAH